MIVVADTTPLNYLVLIGQIELLSVLYQRVLIPQEVHRELQQSRTPATVSQWAASLPAWCEVRAASSNSLIPLSANSILESGRPFNLRWKPGSTPYSWTKAKDAEKRCVVT